MTRREEGQYSEVSLDEFRRFVAEYPRPLEAHLSTIFEPPKLMMNDFVIGRYPDSVVCYKNTSVEGPPPFATDASYFVRTDLLTDALSATGGENG